MQKNKDQLFYCQNNVWREDKPNNQRRYYLETLCEKCNQPFFTDLYKKSRWCSSECAGPRPGRPFNYKVSDTTKDKIATTMSGSIRPVEVKERIKKGVLEGRKMLRRNKENG